MVTRTLLEVYDLAEVVPRSFGNSLLNQHHDEQGNKQSLVFSQQGCSIWGSFLFILIDVVVLFSANWYWEYNGYRAGSGITNTRGTSLSALQPSGEGERTCHFP